MFMTESHLSMLCKSLCYAPLTLEKAAQEPDSVNRMKYIGAFALGLNNAYLTMEKPFNPILG